MPRHLISDVHEWRNEISTVPVFTIAILHSRERACNPQRGKKTLLCLTLVCLFGEAILYGPDISLLSNEYKINRERSSI